MKRIHCLWLSILMLLSLCSCAFQATPTDETRESFTAEEATETASENGGEALGDSNVAVPDKKPSQGGTESPETGSKPAASTPESTTKPKVTTTAPHSESCSHKNTTVKNKSDPSCTASGYTGDTYCKDCNVKLSSGSQLPAFGHHNTELRNRREATTSAPGYTGDVYCKDCGSKISDGKAIPKIENPNEGKIEYILPDGTSVFVDANVKDVTAYFMAQKTQQTDHLYSEIEKEIVRLCNVEREKAGLQPLAWFEDAYYFTKTRAMESHQLFSHTRPNGKPWYSVYFDAGVVIAGHYGENLIETEGITVTEYAERAVEGWMNSPGHKANILHPHFNRIAVAIVEDGDALTAVQNFFS